MKISYRWLRERVATKLGAGALADRLTLAGLEVGTVQPVAPALDKVVVGEVVSVSAHPGAERLKLCRVRVSDKTMLDIVCGAANVAPGMRAPVALPGARLPGNLEIQESTVRGHVSQGMLCSAAELGLAESSDGLLDLGGEAHVGDLLYKVLQLDDATLEVELTPNRGDCLSVNGLAREISALTGAKLISRRDKPVAVTSRCRLPVTVESGQACPRYTGRVIENINPSARTPNWMTERLRRSNVRSIHPVVDITNYVMLEMGQPMHAFDLSRLSGGLHVRPAVEGEQLTLLDGKTVDVGAGSLLIADDTTPLALAGIMGGHDSAVKVSTRSLFLESAYFTPNAISGRARALGLQTDSSYRFERGVDPNLPLVALERATRLLIDIVGGQAGPVTEKNTRRYLPKISPIRLRPSRIARILGAELPGREMKSILINLGMRVKRAGKNWQVFPPGYRFDIEREEDLIEEIARVHGYHKLPSRLPLMPMTPYAEPEGRITKHRLRLMLVDRDYQEVITYSFVDPAVNILVDPECEMAVLRNPIAADMSVMRTSLWPGLLGALRYNLNRQASRVRLFEIGRCYTPVENGFRQDPRIGGVLFGSDMAEQWGSPSRKSDFFTGKADIEALLELTGRADKFRFRPSTHPALHPGQSADIVAGDDRMGYVGVLHPAIAGKLGMDQNVILFELELSVFQNTVVPVFSELSRFPHIRRDLAFIVDENVTSAAIIQSIKSVSGRLLIDLELFDEYRGKGIDSGRKSLALGLTFQHSSRTLKEEEAEAETTKVIRALETQLNAQLRR